MRCFCRTLILTIAALAPTVAFAADTWWAGTWKGWKREFHHNNVWPEQYLDHDRSVARAPFEMMVANGWRLQNTISSYHFNEQTGELNETGRLKLKSILFETPAAYRSIYILRADDPRMTAARVKSVQEQGLGLLQGELLPPMMITSTDPRGARGDWTNGVHQRFIESAPPPVLPEYQRQTEE